MSLGWRSGILAVGALALASVLHGCTPSDVNGANEPKEPVQPPLITQKMPLPKALEAGIDFGGETMADVKRLIKKRNESAKAAKLVADALHEGFEAVGDPRADQCRRSLRIAAGAGQRAALRELVASATPWPTTSGGSSRP